MPVYKPLFILNNKSIRDEKNSKFNLSDHIYFVIIMK